uniref:Uncharacterized protein n=1 Tax=Macaca mulatta TaxID=9544 RepID=A0A5F7ZVD9_MACMU
LRNLERQSFLLQPIKLPAYSVGCLFTLMFICAEPWLTLSLSVPSIRMHKWRFKHCGSDQPDVCYDPYIVWNSKEISICRLNNWCKKNFYLIITFNKLYGLIYALYAN